MTLGSPNLTLFEIELALDAGRLSVLMTSGNWWAARRNGRTQLCKTRPGEFHIPIKAGFRATGELNHQSRQNIDFRIQP